ncbi:MAG TPA: hypothetical protein VF729_01505 [Solirubrobacterales bacterium]
MERGEELMELNRQTSDRHAAAFGHVMARFDRHDKVFEQHEKAFTQHERTMEQHGKAMQSHERAMEQHGKAMQSHEQAFAKHEEVMERVTAALDRHEAQADDLKIFIRDQNRRSEKVVQHLLRRSEAFNAEQSRRTDAIVARLEEVTKEQKAQREALLRVIDRLPPPAEAA